MKKLSIPENWSSRDALAVHDFLVDIVDAIWLEYEDAMIDALQTEEDDLMDKNDPILVEEFNDDIPF